MDMSREMTLDLVISGQDLFLVQEEDLLLVKEEDLLLVREEGDRPLPPPLQFEVRKPQKLESRKVRKPQS